MPLATLESWVQQGLLDVQPGPGSGQRLVDEEQMQNLAETLGWLELSGESWDGPEET